MKSFVSWLGAAMAVGATIGTIVRPGIFEIAIVWAASIALWYGYRSFKRDGSVLTSS